MSIRIAIADDHPLVINGISNILPHYPHITMVASYPDGKTLLEGLKESIPDVLLLDVQMPGQTGDELAPLIVEQYPTLKILVLTNFDSPLYINSMFTRGVNGYVLKSASNETIIEAIETVNAGGRFLKPELQAKMEQAAYKIQKALSSKTSLTLREREILQLIVDGCTNTQIATQLFLSAKTVDNFRTHIMTKLEVNNVAQLVKKALQMGLAK